MSHIAPPEPTETGKELLVTCECGHESRVVKTLDRPVRELYLAHDAHATEAESQEMLRNSEQ